MDFLPTTPDSSAHPDREKLAKFLGERVLSHISGTGNRREEDFKSVLDRPSDQYFAGQIVSRESQQLNNLSEELQTKLSPSAIQAEFLIDPEETDTLEITVSGNLYYRSFPTFEEQKSSAAKQNESQEDAETENSQNSRLERVFRRLQFETPEIKIDVPSLEESENKIQKTQLGEEKLENLFNQLKSRLRDIDGSESEPPVWRSPTISEDDFDQKEISTKKGEYWFDPEFEENEDSFKELLEKIQESNENIVIPPWSLEVNAAFEKTEEGKIRTNIFIENSSKANPDKGNDQFGSYDYDTTFFDLTSNIRLDKGSFPEFEFERLEKDFRYDRNIPGHGTNCTVTKKSDSELVTEYLPSYRQKNYTTRNPQSLGEDLDTSFETMQDLQNGGIESLEEIASAMRKYLEDHEKGYQKQLENHYLSEESDEFSQSDKEDFEEDMAQFRREIKKFERGIKCLKWSINTNRSKMAEAFELMNETFGRKVTREDGSKEFDSWYMFQLVFIVSMIPDIANREYDDLNEEWLSEESFDKVDILWFPTGGGKTEAYLGTAVLNAFFDRLRGKKYGVTAWTRFPLRLLSLQQTQRFAEILMYAELVRLEQDSINGADYMPFSLGYLVGSRNTPNKLSGYQDPRAEKGYLHDYDKYSESEELREETKTFPSCPICESEVKLVVTDDIRLAHRCTGDAEECEWKRRDMPDSDYYAFKQDELPVHIVDNELYRYAPTMIVGTIDKITAVGNERKSAHLYGGKMETWCSEHGFSSLGECTEKYGCHEDKGGHNDPESTLVPLEETDIGTPYDSSPGLQIQDELHLIKESLGTFDGHYETFTETYQQETGGKKTKIIGATATIKEYQRQVKQIYSKDARRFPAPGPLLGENFYAETEEHTQRHYIGVMPHGKTHINAVIDLIYYYLKEINLIRDQISDSDSQHSLIDELDIDVDGNSGLKDLLLDYETALVYTISKKEKDRLTESIKGQLSKYLRSEDLNEPNLEELTGDTTFDKVEEVLKNLENPPEELEKRLNVIAATNMISHGVDIDRFNYMIFYGMPRQTAEYIQSSSRVGRKYPGMVINCFNPARERDQSHYHLFEKYHEFLDRLVEPVPVNRWSQFSVKRTLPGVFFGWMLNKWMYESQSRLYFANNAAELARSLKAGITDADEFSGIGITDQEELEALMRASYGEDGELEPPEAFISQMRKEVDRVLNNLESSGEGFASDKLTPGPMNSLRDIDQMLKIRPEDQKNENIMDTLTR